MTDQISYKFEFESGACFDFEVPTRGWTESAATAGQVPPDWTRLEVNQCAVCPLSSSDHKYCPAAVDLRLEQIGQRFVGGRSGNQILVQLGQHHLVAEQLSGLVIHASVEETMTRVVGAYLMKQYFIAGNGGEPDWELKNLRALYESLENVNQSLMARLRKASGSDSNLNAMLGFVSFAQLYTAGLDELLEQEKADFLGGL